MHAAKLHVHFVVKTHMSRLSRSWCVPYIRMYLYVVHMALITVIRDTYVDKVWGFVCIVGDYTYVLRGFGDIPSRTFLKNS